MSEANHEPRQCEACSVRDTSGISGVHTTNGHLFLCGHCLGDINRKNPELAALRSRVEQLEQTIRRECEDSCELERDLEALFAPLGIKRESNPDFTEPIYDVVKRGVEQLELLLSAATRSPQFMADKVAGIARLTALAIKRGTALTAAQERLAKVEKRVAAVFSAERQQAAGKAWYFPEQQLMRIGLAVQLEFEAATLNPQPGAKPEE